MAGRPTKQADCEGKSRFRSYRAAKRSAHRISRKEDMRMHVYHCRLCGCMHVGSLLADA